MYNVVKYDVMSFKAGANYGDPDVATPSIEKVYTTRAEAEEYAARQTVAASEGENIEIELMNGGKYAGPRYIYRIGID